MAAKGSKSKKPSAAISQTSQPERPIFFLDRCLGRKVVADALRAAGEIVEVHHDHFEQTAPDAEWLPIVGKNGWVVLTKDRNIKTNQIEVVSLLSANIACFSFVSADTTGPDMAIAFVAALGDMHRMLAKFQKPFVATVTRSGAVHLLHRYIDLVKKIE